MTLTPPLRVSIERTMSDGAVRKVALSVADLPELQRLLPDAWMMLFPDEFFERSEALLARLRSECGRRK